MPGLARLQITSESVSAADELGFDYILKWSKRRRSLAIEVAPDEVVVRAPFGVNKGYIHEFVVSKRHWVVSKLGLQANRQAEVPQRQYQAGEVIPWLGEDYRLQVEAAASTSIEWQDKAIVVSLAPRAQLKTQLLNWYRQQAEQLLADKTAYFAECLGVSIESIQFRKTKTKWGHCTREGVIQYNWLIALAPEPVVDYLVAHEVSHRRYMNHGPRFWQTVEKLCPGHLQQRQWLKRYGHTLVL